MLFRSGRVPGDRGRRRRDAVGTDATARAAGPAQAQAVMKRSAPTSRSRPGRKLAAVGGTSHRVGRRPVRAGDKWRAPCRVRAGNSQAADTHDAEGAHNSVGRRNAVGADVIKADQLHRHRLKPAGRLTGRRALQPTLAVAAIRQRPGLAVRRVAVVHAAALASTGAATSMQGRPSGCGQLWSGTRAQRTSGRSDSQVTRPAVACSMFGQRSGGTRPFQPHTDGVLMPSMRATAAGPPIEPR